MRHRYAVEAHRVLCSLVQDVNSFSAVVLAFKLKLETKEIRPSEVAMARTNRNETSSRDV